MSGEKRFNLHNPILFAAIMAVGMFLGFKLKSNLRFEDAQATQSGNVNEIIQLVNTNYVDSVGTDSVETKAIEQLLSQLDPHTVYIPPKDMQEVDNDLEGEFDGIGIEYMMQRDTLLVSGVIDGGPSMNAGIQTGDRFLKVGDSTIAGKKISTEGIVKLLRGTSGSKVKINVLRKGKVLKEIVITRGKIPLNSIDASYMVDAKTGYIKINRFSMTTHNEFVQKLKELKGKGITQLILDLRDNPGGFLDEAVKITDEFVDGKKKVVYTKGRNNKSETYMAERTGMFESGKLVVLVDEGSASAAEIVSGALQDYDRATIVGRRTFGKGLVQEQYPLNNGGALRITVARYFIPSGRCIQKDYSKGVNQYYDDVNNRFKHGDLNSKDSIIYTDTTIYKTFGGKRVYGGGGIMPDIFVPLTTNDYNESLYLIVSSGLLSEVVNDFVENQKESLTQYKSVENFIANYKLAPSLMIELKQKCSRDSINLASFKIPKDVALIQQRMKAQLAKSLYGFSSQYQVLNMNDKMIEKAMESFK